MLSEDDIRREMSSAYENGKRFLADGAVPLLMTLASDFQSLPDLAAAALSAVRQLVLSVEAVKVVSNCGAMDLPKNIFQYAGSQSSLIRSVTGFMRNLCADDVRKNSFVNDGTLALMVDAMTQEAMQSDAAFMEHAFACLAAMALRFPSNALRILELGAVQEIVHGMRKHEDKPSLQRQGCLAIRNIAARSPELRTRILDTGAEEVLRFAGRQQEAVDEAYGALRDLECEVQYVKISETGEVEAAHAQFGGQKPKFNPVFDETYDLEQRVESEARAPFAADSKSVFRSDMDQDEADLLNMHKDTVAHVHSDSCSH
jgi:armadillo repeat-containing protein 6